MLSRMPVSGSSRHTIADLTAVVVRSGLADAGIDFGVFEPKATHLASKRQTQFAVPNGNGHAISTGEEIFGEEEEVTDERQARAVIKLRPPRHRNPSRSRSRRDLSQAAKDDRQPTSPDATDRESVANVRFSAHVVAKADLKELLPFALITPEGSKRRQRPLSPDSRTSSMSPSSPDRSLEGDPALSVNAAPQTPASAHSARIPYLQGPPDDLKGVFIRNYRWGTIDVLDPNHCDFAALRTAVLSTHIKVCMSMRLSDDDPQPYLPRFSKLTQKRSCMKNTEQKNFSLVVLRVTFRKARGSVCWKAG